MRAQHRSTSDGDDAAGTPTLTIDERSDVRELMAKLFKIIIKIENTLLETDTIVVVYYLSTLQPAKRSEQLKYITFCDIT